ncbi:hypothetical protein SAMN02745248_01597 [Hathewaya proteolytica DSM 3090]|uniref:ABC-2 family transporter protein n=1 Tax=Hathewaya proteolytica DSM 3090 TaxID=1121331 RepID=A0A1M6P5M7_9CLOT|nr:ABC transporter permease subunit [Hathewaya proteolytica]SHK03238.1 hypothetical protein SAMN02745248_01597 [Hathewaya proteolytica DSM 3090]
MNIKKLEFKKIISSPIFIILTLIFLAYNTRMIINKSHNIKNSMKVLNEIVSELGYVINDDMILEFKSYYENKLNEANNILNKKGYGSYNTIGQFFQENVRANMENSELSNEERVLLENISTIENYYFFSTELQQKYDSIDINRMAQSELAKSRHSDTLKSFIKRNYDEFAIRFNELKENGEHKNLFFYGMKYRMHSFLFNDLLTKLIYETMILIVLSTAFVLNYEFENKTATVIYSTRRGRNLIKDKLFSALIFAILATTIVVGTTLLIYFSVFDYSGLWGTSVSSCFAQEFSIPYLTWFTMSVGKYLALSVLVIYTLELIFFGLTFMLASFTKNTYITFGMFVIMLGGGIILPGLMPNTLNIVIATVYTPFILILNTSWWFMLKSDICSNKYYEIVTLISWSIGVFIVGALCVKKFKKESIK